MSWFMAAGAAKGTAQMCKHVLNESQRVVGSRHGYRSRPIIARASERGRRIRLGHKTGMVTQISEHTDANEPIPHALKFNFEDGY